MKTAIAGVALAAVVFVAAAPASEEEEVARCHGRRATIVGTEKDDVLRGTPGPRRDLGRWRR